jgi:RHS repeat-associated protein
MWKNDQVALAPRLGVASKAMSALARTHVTDSFTRAANDACIKSGSCTRTKYTYDADGHTQSYGIYTFTYYNDGRVKSVGSSGGSTTTYVYNALGQRIEKTGGPAGTVLMFYDEAGHVLGEYSGTGTLVQETVWMGDLPVATIRPSGSSVAVYYVHADHLGAPRMVTQPSSNKIAWRWDTDPFGTVAPNQNPAGLGTFIYNLRYPGQYYDSETGLGQNYFRDYDPLVGRYLESDPMGLDAGINTYTFVADAPVGSIDPYGLLSVVEEWNFAQSIQPPPIGSISSETKAYLCTLLRQTNGQFQLAWSLADGQRKSDLPASWGNPVWQEAENWLYSAGWPPGWDPDNLFNWQNTDAAIALHQLLKYPFPRGHSAPSMAAYLAAMEARRHRDQRPKDVLKWCDGCSK